MWSQGQIDIYSGWLPQLACVDSRHSRPCRPQQKFRGHIVTSKTIHSVSWSLAQLPLTYLLWARARATGNQQTRACQHRTYEWSGCSVLFSGLSTLTLSDEHRTFELILIPPVQSIGEVDDWRIIVSVVATNSSEIPSRLSHLSLSHPTVLTITANFGLWSARLRTSQLKSN